MNRLFSSLLGAACLLASSAGCGGDDSGGLSLTPGQAPAAPLAGCHPERPALAHYAGALALEKQPAQAPYPCSSKTGVDAVDTSILISAQGELLVAPGPAAALARSTDNGATWTTNVRPDPRTQPSALWLHPWLWRDNASGRLFYSSFDSNGLLNGTLGTKLCQGQGGGGTDLWTSDDGGKTWSTGYVGCGSMDYGKIITGPAVSAASKSLLAQNSYPSVVYFCATGPTYLTGPSRMCFKSYDGGKSFARTKADPVSDASNGWPTAGAVGPDGTLYVAHTAPEGMSVAISSDESDSWRNVVIRDAVSTQNSTGTFLSHSVAVDEQNNLYVTWVDERDGLPYLAVSRDKGASWPVHLMIGAPDVRFSALPGVAVKKPGYVAVGYYGSPDAAGNGSDGYFTPDGRPYNAYVVASADVFAEQPLLWTTQINEPGSSAFVSRNFSSSEYVGPAAFGADGSIWSAFVQDGDGLVGRLTDLPTEKP